VECDVGDVGCMLGVMWCDVGCVCVCVGGGGDAEGGDAVPSVHPLK
jgi:hypothetical protein